MNKNEKAPIAAEAITNKQTKNTMNFVSNASETGWRARQWIRDNPKAWEYAVNLALHEAHAKRRISMSWIIEQVRRKDFARSDNEPFKINNTLNSAFARIMAMDYPETKPFIEFRKAACDGLIPSR